MSEDIFLYVDLCLEINTIRQQIATEIFRMIVYDISTNKNRQELNGDSHNISDIGYLLSSNSKYRFYIFVILHLMIFVNVYSLKYSVAQNISQTLLWRYSVFCEKGV